MAQLDDNGLIIGSTAAAPQHFNIGASVSSNAITVTLNPCTIGFRSTTLTSGSLSVRQITSPITLTIAATDSFGLITAAGNQRIVILACDTGSTIQLAASSLAGGIALTEDNLITTVTAATSGNHIKSTSVLTNIAYRVVGIVDATFTTGTGWGSLTLVQPCGGIVGAGMRSLGYGQTWQSFSVGTQRVYGTKYYNTTGKPIQLSLVTSNIGSIVFTVTIGIIDVYNNVTGTSGDIFNGQWVVPPGMSYSISVAGGTPTISIWTELR